MEWEDQTQRISTNGSKTPLFNKHDVLKKSKI